MLRALALHAGTIPESGKRPAALHRFGFVVFVVVVFFCFRVLQFSFLHNVIPIDRESKSHMFVNRKTYV